MRIDMVRTEPPGAAARRRRQCEQLKAFTTHGGSKCAMYRISGPFERSARVSSQTEHKTCRGVSPVFSRTAPAEIDSDVSGVENCPTNRRGMCGMASVLQMCLCVQYCNQLHCNSNPPGVAGAVG